MQHDKLLPRLGLFSASMVLIGSIIGSGIFKKISPMTLKLQSEWLVLLCWLLAGLITLFGALTYAEISGRLAQTGGLYAYLRSMYGKATGYIFGWACFSVIQSASIASIAYVFAEAILRLFPFSFSDGLAGYETKFLAAGTILALTLVNCLGVLFGAFIENIFTVLKIAGILLVAALGLMFSNTNLPAEAAASITPVVPQGMDLARAMFSAMLGAFWAYDGFNNIGYIGGEIKNAKVNIPRALIFGVAGILVVYLLVNFSYFHALSLKGVLSVAEMPEKIFAIEMLDRILGSNWALFVAVLIMVSTFGATNGSILTSARIYFAMAKDGVFFNIAQKISRRDTPMYSLILQGAWAASLIFIGSFDDLTDMLIFASFIFYGLGAWGLFILRKRNSDYDGFKVPSLIPYIYILFCATLVVITLVQDPVGSGKGLLLIATGIPLYLWFTRKTT